MDCDIDILLLHYTGMPSKTEALERLCDPNAKVSAHYLIDESGVTYQLVAEERCAWHAGESCWSGEHDINGRSIGIELANPGHEWGYRPFPERQMDALMVLAREILTRHGIVPTRVLGHSDVAPTRRQDPGELFDWRSLANAGVGLWPREMRLIIACASISVESGGEEITSLQQSLARFGYEINATGSYDETTAHVTMAFQRHFRPGLVNGVADSETCSVLLDLLDQKDSLTF